MKDLKKNKIQGDADPRRHGLWEKVQTNLIEE